MRDPEQFKAAREAVNKAIQELHQSVNNIHYVEEIPNLDQLETKLRYAMIEYTNIAMWELGRKVISLTPPPNQYLTSYESYGTAD